MDSRHWSEVRGIRGEQSSPRRVGGRGEAETAGRGDGGDVKVGRGGTWGGRAQ